MTVSKKENMSPFAELPMRLFRWDVPPHTSKAVHRSERLFLSALVTLDMTGPMQTGHVAKIIIALLADIEFL